MDIARQLALLGATPVAERVVIDRNRITGAGVTSGIDFALTLAAMIFGEDRARMTQLAMEYDPEPPFAGGSVATAAPGHAETLRERAAPFLAQRVAAAKRAGEALGRAL